MPAVSQSGVQAFLSRLDLKKLQYLLYHDGNVHTYGSTPLTDHLCHCLRIFFRLQFFVFLIIFLWMGAFIADPPLMSLLLVSLLLILLLLILLLLILLPLMFHNFLLIMVMYSLIPRVHRCNSLSAISRLPFGSAWRSHPPGRTKGVQIPRPVHNAPVPCTHYP